MASTKSEKDEETRAEDAEERAAASEEEREAAAEAPADSEASDEAGVSADEDGETDDAEAEASGDGGEAEDGAEEATSDESDEPAAASTAARAAEAPKSKKGRRRKEGPTAGARLAAAKAAKAARKAAKRGKEKQEQDPLQQVRESELAKKAQEASSWAADNRNLVIATAIAFLVLIGGWVGWSLHSASQARAAGSLLAAALEIAQAEVVSEDEDGASAATDDGAPTFPSEEARAEAALEAYRRVLSEHGGTDAAIWARLGEADALAALGRYDEARQAYEAAEHEGSSEPGVLLRAMEGRAFTYEAEQQWDRALEVFEQLAATDNRSYEPIAQYHIARMYIEKGERERATETLRGVVEKLTSGDEENSAAQRLHYVRTQAQTRLAELDPSAAPARRSGGSMFGGAGGGPGGAPGELSNEQLQELIRQFQLQQQQEQQAGGE